MALQHASHYALHGANLPDRKGRKDVQYLSLNSLSAYTSTGHTVGTHYVSHASVSEFSAARHVVGEQIWLHSPGPGCLLAQETWRAQSQSRSFWSTGCSLGRGVGGRGVLKSC